MTDRGGAVEDFRGASHDAARAAEDFLEQARQAAASGQRAISLYAALLKAAAVADPAPDHRCEAQVAASVALADATAARDRLGVCLAGFEALLDTASDARATIARQDLRS